MSAVSIANQPVGELAHLLGVFCGSITTQSSDLHGSCCLARFAASDRERPSLVGQRNTACPPPHS